MVGPVTFESLRARYERDLDEHGWMGRPESFARALEGSGFGAEHRAELAGILGIVFDACFAGHRDVPTLRRDVADLMRHMAAAAGGGLASVSVHEPRAEAFLCAYATQVD